MALPARLRLRQPSPLVNVAFLLGGMLTVLLLLLVLVTR
jgi:hypothetical protein